MFEEWASRWMRNAALGRQAKEKDKMALAHAEYLVLVLYFFYIACRFVGVLSFSFHRFTTALLHLTLSLFLLLRSCRKPFSTAYEYIQISLAFS